MKEERNVFGRARRFDRRLNEAGSECSLAALLRAPAREDGELLQDGTTEHLGVPSKHPKRQAGPAVGAPGSAHPFPLLAVPVSWVVSLIDAPW